MPLTSSDSFADQIRTAFQRQMTRTGLTYTELARRLDCTPGNAKKLLQVASTSKISTIERLAKAFNLELPLVLGCVSAKPLASCPDPKRRAQEVWRQERPAVRAEIAKQFGNGVSEPRRPGRKRGPLYDYEPHLKLMSSIVFIEKLSQREAARKARNWAATQPASIAKVSDSTLRKHFAKNRKRLHRLHELSLERVQRKTTTYSRPLRKVPPELRGAAETFSDGIFGTHTTLGHSELAGGPAVEAPSAAWSGLSRTIESEIRRMKNPEDPLNQIAGVSFSSPIDLEPITSSGLSDEAFQIGSDSPLEGTEGLLSALRAVEDPTHNAMREEITRHDREKRLVQEALGFDLWRHSTDPV